MMGSINHCYDLEITTATIGHRNRITCQMWQFGLETWNYPRLRSMLFLR